MANYVVTAHRASAVDYSLVGRFTRPDTLSLAVCHSTRLVIHELGPDGLMECACVELNGRVCAVSSLRPRGSVLDWIVILTEKFKMCVVSFDAERGVLVTHGHGDMAEKVMRPKDERRLVRVDHGATMIAMQIYMSLLKIVPVSEDGTCGEAFDLRLDEAHVIDMQFLHSSDTRYPTLAILYEDSKYVRHLRAYAIDVAGKAIIDIPGWSIADVDPFASFIVPIPDLAGSVLVIGEMSITHIAGPKGKRTASGGSVRITTAMPSCEISAYGLIDQDGRRILIGDTAGSLSVVALRGGAVNDGSVNEIIIETLGRVSPPSTISYLDNGCVFVGSRHGDSQLVRLLPEQDPTTGSNVAVLEAFPNIGPIQDMCVVDLDQGQGQVITCSGGGPSGSLRIVRNGIGIEEQATIDLPGIMGMWSLRAAPPRPVVYHDDNDDDNDNDNDDNNNNNNSNSMDTDSAGYELAPHRYLVQSFYGETRVLAIAEASLTEDHIEGLDAASPTIFCGDTHGFDMIIQVTGTGVRLIDSVSGALVDQWPSQNGGGAEQGGKGGDIKINSASGNGSQVLLALAGGTLVYLEAKGRTLVECGRTSLGHEIACVDISPLSADSAVVSDSSSVSFPLEGPRSEICVVGMWTELSMIVMSLPDLKPIVEEPLGGEVVPRSVLISEFEEQAYLLCGLANGCLMTYTLDRKTGELGDRKKLTLGTHPVLLSLFGTAGVSHVFAASDRPAVIYSKNRKLLCSNVNLRNVSHVCPFDCDLFPDGFAVSTDSQFLIGTIDDIQKLHIRTVPLGETPRRIAHAPSKACLAVITAVEPSVASTEEMEGCFVRVLDDATMDVVSSYPFRSHEFELATALTACTFASEPTETYFVAGCASADPSQSDCKKGRIVVLAVNPGGGDLHVASEVAIDGAPYALKEINGKLLATVNDKLVIYDWKQGPSGAFSLEVAAVRSGQVISLCVDVVGDNILVGDLMSSGALYRYTGGDVIEEVARHVSAEWVSAVHSIDDETYLMGGNTYNFYTLSKNSGAANEEDRRRLSRTGVFHVGTYVNCFRRGSLVMQLPENESLASSSHLFGSTDGVIGAVLRISDAQYNLFLRVQNSLRRTVAPAGGLDHEDWRAYSSESLTQIPAEGYIDGDLIESFLDLDRSTAQAISANVGVQVDALTKAIEDMARIH